MQPMQKPMQDDYHIHIVYVTICLMIFGPHMNILFILIVRMLMFIEVVTSPPNYVEY